MRVRHRALGGKVSGFAAARAVVLCLRCGVPTNKLDGWAKLSQDQRLCGRCGGGLVRMPSLMQARRYQYLLKLAMYREIAMLHTDPRYPCEVTAYDAQTVTKVCTYTADFAYILAGAHVIEDVKGSANYSDSGSAIRRKLAEALHGVRVRIIDAAHIHQHPADWRGDDGKTKRRNKRAAQAPARNRRAGGPRSAAPQ